MMMVIIKAAAALSLFTVPATIPFITSGRLRGLAVLAMERAPTLPGVPTTAESGMPELVVIT